MIRKLRFTGRIHLLPSLLLAALLVGSGLACGPEPVCQEGQSRACKCDDKDGTQLCNQEGLGYTACKCKDTEKGIGSEKNTIEKDKPEPTPEPEPEVGAEPEPEAEPEAEPESESEPEPEAEAEPEAEPEMSPEDAGSEVIPEKAGCSAKEFEWKNKCYRTEDFCKGATGSNEFPKFSSNVVKMMKQPFVIEFDLISKKPLFCQTNAGYYYLSSAGYGKCDLDGDGWINIEAYRAVTSTDKQIQSNARCALQEIHALAYHQENNKSVQLQMMKDASGKQLKIPLVETFRNDGGEKIIEMPIYSENQTPLPKLPGSRCKSDKDCNKQVCYLGHCISGRRFEAAELNTFTKACIAAIDLNDNQLDDASETPSDNPTPSSEFKPLLNGGYFVELHYGFFQKDYKVDSKRYNVYHIYERNRLKAPNVHGLALRCQESSSGFTPDFWKRCQLKDDQACKDPNNPGKLLRGLSKCWLKDVKRSIPSLFKCVVHDNTTTPVTLDGYFHPSNYGFTRNYNRTRCKITGGLNTKDPKKRDVQFSCSVDDGKRKPDPSKKEVGWACVSFKPYKTSKDYLAGCVDQIAEKVCGSSKDGKTVTYIKHEQYSYGLARAKADCGSSNGKGDCSFPQRTCTGGQWLACNKCDHCPQHSAQARKECPKKIWPSGSCKLQKFPSRETCDGRDNDCDGQIDEGLNAHSYYRDADGDGEGDPNQRKILCTSKVPSGYVTNNKDCNDKDKAINTKAIDICDGKDNNCNILRDDHATKSAYYRDDDGDKYPSTATVFYACVKHGTTDVLCNISGQCFSIKYKTSNGQTRTYIKPRSDGKNDCCDTDAKAFPGQTTYFGSQNACKSWDYNCDGKSTKDVKTCSCARSVKFVESGFAWHVCGGTSSCSSSSKRGVWAGVRCTDHSNGQTGTQSTKKVCTKTVTNSVNCKYSFTHKLQTTTDKRCSHKCGFKSCSETSKSSDVTLTHVVSNMIAFKSNDYSKGCVFFNNNSGKVPACGESGQVAPSSEGQSKNYIKTLKNPYRMCTRDGIFSCGGACYGKGYDWRISYSGYTFVKEGSSQRQVKCR